MESLPEANADLILLVHKFFVSLFDVQGVQEEDDRWTSPFLCYFAVKAMRDDRNFIGPEALANWLGRFKYLAVNMSMVDAWYNKKDHSEGMIG